MNEMCNLVVAAGRVE